MPTEPNASRRNPQSTAAILRAALELAQDEGWSKVSIEGIAARAGVGKRTIYRWWPSKGAVVLDAYAARLQESAFMQHGTTTSGDVVVDLRRVNQAWVETIGGSERLVASLIGEAQHDGDLAERLWARLIAPANERALIYVKAARERGELAADIDPYRATELIYGQIYLRMLLTPHQIDAAFLDDCVDLALRGLRP